MMLVLSLTFAVSISAPHDPLRNLIKDDRKPRVIFHDRAIVGAGGTVVGISGNESLNLLQPGGKNVVQFYPTYDHLRRGKLRRGVGESDSYLMSDVRVGDFVSIGTYKERDTVYCVEISIFKRPGGLVPPARVPSPFAELGHKQYHIRMNAANAERTKLGVFPDK